MDITMMKHGSAQVLMQFVRRMLLEVNTAIPAEIVAFNAEFQTATVKPCIRGTSITNNGKTVFTDLPQILQVPVFFPYSTTTGFSLTYPVRPGDQCLLIFSQRSFDNWLVKGSVQNPSETNAPRSHQYCDALALIGFAPNPVNVKDFQEDGVEIRNVNRDSFVKLTNETVHIHEKHADIVLNYNGETDLLIQETELIDGEWIPTGAISSVRIGRDGTTTVTSSKAVNITSADVNIASANVNITSGVVNIASDIVNFTSTAVSFSGNVIVGGNMLAATYSVGSISDKKDGISGTKDNPECKNGLVVGGV